jgi:ABC-type multidrug transport system fused ATPase/permease subunit
MSGTIRQNLDPFGEVNNATLSAELSATQSEDDEIYIGLDSSVSAGGSNFSHKS